MTTEVVALLHQPPSAEALARALLAAGPDLRVGQLAEGAVLQLFDDTRTLVASIDVAARINTAGEAERLLGTPSPPRPYWWLEIRTPAMRPDARAIAEAVAHALAAELGGMTI